MSLTGDKLNVEIVTYYLISLLVLIYRAIMTLKITLKYIDHFYKSISGFCN